MANICGSPPLFVGWSVFIRSGTPPEISSKLWGVAWRYPRHDGLFRLTNAGDKSFRREQ
jgi:hypothetical protein